VLCAVQSETVGRRVCCVQCRLGLYVNVCVLCSAGCNCGLAYEYLGRCVCCVHCGL